VNGADGQRSALVVATSEYDDPKFRQLRAPSSDAAGLARVLADPDVGAYEVETTVNEQEHVISRKLEAFFSDRRPQDLLLLHLSCHGVKDQRGDLYFAARDTLLGSLKASAVSSSFVIDLMRDSRAGRIVLFLDCCYSGAFAKGFVTRGDDDVHIVERFAGEGRAVITASKSTEYAFEGEELSSAEPQPSIFTMALIRGLETGDADRDHDGLISFDDLYDYVYDEVLRSTPGQTPSKSVPKMEGRLYIARSRRPAQLPVAMLEAAESPLPGVREGAVMELKRLVGASNPGLSAAALSALRLLADGDDSQRVREAAAAALGTERQPPPPPPPPPPPFVRGPPPEPTPGPRPDPRRPFWVQRRWQVALGAAAAALAVGFVLLLTRDDGGKLAWSDAGGSASSEFGGTGRQAVSAIATHGTGDTQAIAVGYDRDPETIMAVWTLRTNGWQRVRPLQPGQNAGAFNAVASAASPGPGGRVAVAVGRSGEMGSGQSAAIWALGPDGWLPVCPTACRDSAAPGLGPGPRQQEVFAVVESSTLPGSFVAVGADQNTALDRRYDAAVWVLDADGPARRVALGDAALGGDRQQQMLGIVGTDAGLVAVGQDGLNAGVWRSTDNGTTWTKLQDPGFKAQPGATQVMFGVAAHGADLVAVGAEGDAEGNRNRAAVWVLRAASGTWARGTSSDFQPRGQVLKGVTVAPSGELVAVGYDGGEKVRRASVWTSTNGIQWKQRPGAPSGEGKGEMTGVVLLGDTLLAAGIQGVPRSADGRVWTATAPR
jgi:hypothetical protein